MNNVEKLYRDIQDLRERAHLMTGEHAWDILHLEQCADLLQEAMDTLEGVTTI